MPHAIWKRRPCPSAACEQRADWNCPCDLWKFRHWFFMNKHHISVEQKRRYRNSVGHGCLAYSMWHRAFLAGFWRGCEGWWQELLQNQPAKSQKVWHILRATVHWRHLLRIVEEKSTASRWYCLCTAATCQIAKMDENGSSFWNSSNAVWSKLACAIEQDEGRLLIPTWCKTSLQVSLKMSHTQASWALTARVGSGHWLPL